MAMSEERKREIAEHDTSFIPGGKGQGKKRLPGTPKGEMLPAVMLPHVVEARNRWKKHVESVEPFNEKAAQQAVRELIARTITADDLQAIIIAAQKGAERGDPIARKWLMDYLAGASAEKIELDAGENLAEMIRRSMEPRDVN